VWNVESHGSSEDLNSKSSRWMCKL
jgi:hypothetical protein